MPPMGGVTGAMKGTGGSMGKKKERPKNTKNTIIRLFSYMKETKLQLAGALCCVLASTASTLAASYMLRPVINNYIIGFNENGGIKSLAMALVVMASVYLLGVLATYFQAKLMLKVSQRAMFSLRRDLFVHMQKLPVSFFDMNSKGDLMSRYTNDVDVVGEMLNSTAVQLFSGIMTLVGTFAMMIYTNIWLSLITFVMSPVIIYSGRFLVSRSRKYYAAQQKSLGALNGCIEETISGQRVVKVFCHEKQAVENFRKYNYDLKDKQIKAQFFGGIMGPVVGNLGQVNYSLTAMIGGILCVLKGFDIGGLTIFVTYARQFSRPINEITMQMNTIFSALAGAERVFDICDMEVEDVTGDIPDNVKGEIVMDDVTFGYRKDTPVLKHISLVAKKGQKIAFVGSTGAGKTTFLNALSNYIPKGERLITIEDNAELQIQGVQNLVRLEARGPNAEGEGAVTIRDLIKSALRMRPDRIVVGEVRGEETVDMISSAMLNGHSGSMSTGHANNPTDMLHRLETMMLMGIDLPLQAIQRQVASALDIIIHLGRLRDKTRKVLQIVEVEGYEDGRIQTKVLYEFKEEGMKNGKIQGCLMKKNEITNKEKLLAAGYHTV